MNESSAGCSSCRPGVDVRARLRPAALLRHPHHLRDVHRGGLTAVFFFIRYRRRSETQTTRTSSRKLVGALFVTVPLLFFTACSSLLPRVRAPDHAAPRLDDVYVMGKRDVEVRLSDGQRDQRAAGAAGQNVRC